MADPFYSWFWVPPLDGKPGLLMIKDDHPGPDSPEVPFLAEGFTGVLQKVESQLPAEVGLFQLSVYLCDPFGIWFMLHVHPTTRQFKIDKPDFEQSELSELWEARERQ